MNTNEEFPVAMNENKCIRVSVPGNYKGTVCVEFREPIFWRISEIVTFVCIMILLAMCGYAIHFGYYKRIN